jgi:hypothetical protein
MLGTWARATGLALIIGMTGGALFIYKARTLSLRTRARGAAALSLVSGTAGGVLLLYYARLASRCTRPAAPSCDLPLTHYAYTWLGVISLLSAVVACVWWLWLARKLNGRSKP